MKFCFSLVNILTMILLCISPVPKTLSNGIYFDDNDPVVMKLGNDSYEIGLKKSNGGIIYIKDKATGSNITGGNLNGCLWVIIFDYDPADYFESCQFWATGNNRFTYTWSPVNQQLTLNYIPDEDVSKTVAASASITAYQDNAFDLQLTITNHWERRTEDIKFPADLVFVKSDINSALLPVLPGLMLKPEFFNQNSGNIQFRYPGFPGGFSDYLSIALSTGSLAMYGEYNETPLSPVKFGFDLNNCADVNTACYTHNYYASVADNATWTSPVIRIRTSNTHEESIMSFREDSLINNSPSLEVKLGSYFNKVTHLPVYKADTTQMGRRFDQYASLFSQIQQPGLLHVVAYQPNGMDEHYPDFLPPDSLWGSTKDMANMFTLAQSKGYLVMPYINPTFWDNESPTLLDLEPPLTIYDIAALDENSIPYWETPGCPDNCHYGYAMSPYAGFVQQRLDELITQIKGELPSDFIFEDQVGARDTKFDYNPASPAPEAFTQGWVNHAEAYAGALLMTECGFDRLITHEIGFHGSALLLEVRDGLVGELSPEYFQYYPFATMLARDKVLFYQHDLAPESFTHNKKNLLVNLAMGYMLSYDLNESIWGGGLEDDWIRVAAEFQRFVLSQYADELVSGYVYLDEEVTRTDFENYHVVSNWSEGNSYFIDGFMLPKQGGLIRKNDNNLIAGLFTRYNDHALSSGDHFLIEERLQEEIIIRQPLGNDTPLTINKLPVWENSTSFLAMAYTFDDRLIGQVPVSEQSETLQFNYQRDLYSQEVSYYKLLEAEFFYLPIINK